MQDRDGRAGWGSDLAQELRPGVPMEWAPHPDPGAHWGIPERQREGHEALERDGLARMTPVYGSALPAHGLSGWVRRRAQRIPDHFARHWMLLLLADRIDAWSFRVRRGAGVLPLAAVAAAVGALAWRELQRA